MITQVVRDYKTQTFESTKDVLEKLKYFRQLSSNGLHNLSESEIASLKTEIIKFFNLNLAFWADSYPTKLFRLTNNKFLYGGQKVKLQKVSDLIGPPVGLSRINRCNLHGESIFYAALDFRTAIWETKPQKDDYITVSEWKIKNGEQINLHSIFHPARAIPNKDCQKSFSEYIEHKKRVNPNIAQTFEEILKFFCEEFMKPVKENEKINYLFSALMSSSLLKPASEGYSIEAICYPSIQMDYGLTNFALLNSLVFKKLELVEIKVYTVTETNYEDGNKNVEDLIKVSPLILTIKDFDFGNDKIDYRNSRELEMMVELDKKFGRKK
jgi:hypothetical protein